MKTLLLILSMLVAVNYAEAQVLKPCTSEVLRCDLEKILPKGVRTLVSSYESRFDGLNEDEPLIPPYECSLNVYADFGGNAIVVDLDDSEYVASVYALDRSEGKITSGEAAFTVVKNKKFFYRYSDLILSCTLSNK